MAKKLKKPKAASAAADGAKAQLQQGVAKRKHTLVAGGKRALAQRLEAEAVASSSKAAPTSAKAKARKSRATNATIMSAVDGMKASLDELLTANERAHRPGETEPAAGSSLTSKRRQKLVVEETKHMQQVLQHPAFVADPFAALQEHLSNTMAATVAKQREREETREGAKHLWPRSSGKAGKAKQRTRQ